MQINVVSMKNWKYWSKYTNFLIVLDMFGMENFPSKNRVSKEIRIIEGRVILIGEVL